MTTHHDNDQDLKTFDRHESSVRGYVRSFPVIFDRAVGSEMFDTNEARFLDFFAGAGTLNYGHNNPVLKRAMVDYVTRDGIVHGLDMATSAKEAFLDTFYDIILKPRGLEYRLQFPGPTGTNAVEAALKLARKVTGRTNIIAFTNGFHGVSLGAVATTANSHFRDAAGVSLGDVMHMPYCGYLDGGTESLGYLRKVLEDGSSGVDLPAAMIVETVQGEGGVNVASTAWLQGLEQICRDFGVLLIVDDIQVGCGRTGTFFSFEEAGLKPDMVTLSKSISGYGLPMSLVLIKPELDQWEPSEHNGTFRGNNLAFVTATRVLEAYWRTSAFAEEVAAKGKHMAGRLTALAERYPEALDVRGRGMIQGIACRDAEHAGALSAAAFQKGVIVETSGAEDQVVKLLPALTMSQAQLDEGLDVFEACLAELIDVGVSAKSPAMAAKK